MSIIKGFKRKMVAVPASICMSFRGYAMIALTPTGLFWFTEMGALIWTFPLPTINVPIQILLQTVVPVKVFRRVDSAVTALANVASPPGRVISGPMAEVTGTANLFLECSLIGILSMTLSWIFTDIRHVEKMEEETA